MYAMGMSLLGGDAVKPGLLLEVAGMYEDFCAFEGAMGLVNTVISEFPESRVVAKAIHRYSVLCQHPQFELFDEAVRCLQYLALQMENAEAAAKARVLEEEVRRAEREIADAQLYGAAKETHALRNHMGGGGEGEGGEKEGEKGGEGVGKVGGGVTDSDGDDGEMKGLAKGEAKGGSAAGDEDEDGEGMEEAEEAKDELPLLVPPYTESMLAFQLARVFERQGLEESAEAGYAEAYNREAEQVAATAKAGSPEAWILDQKMWLGRATFYSRHRDEILALDSLRRAAALIPADVAVRWGVRGGGERGDERERERERQKEPSLHLREREREVRMSGFQLVF
jgi:hypothetical protein